MKLVWTPHFLKSSKKYCKKFPNKVHLFKSKIILLEKDFLDPSLKTHKLKGKLEASYSCSISFDQRIVFRVENNKIILLNIGSHDEVY